MRCRLLFFLALVIAATTSSLAQIWEQYVLRADSIFRSNPKDSATIINSLLESEKEWYYITTDTGTTRILNPVGEPLWFEVPATKVNESLIVRTKEIRVALLGQNHPHVARSLERIGMLHLRYFRLDSARVIFLKALDIYEKTLGPNNPELGRTLHCLGAIQRYTYRFEEAERYLNRSLRIREEGLHPHDPMISYSLNGLAHLYFNVGRYKDAERLYKRAYAIRAKAYGPTESASLGTLSNIIRLYALQGRYEEAELILRDHEKEFATFDENYVQTIRLYFLQHTFDKGVIYTKGIIDTISKQIDSTSPYVGHLYSLLADQYAALGNYSEAERHYGTAISILKDQSNIGTGNDVESVKKNLADLYCRVGRHEEAVAVYDEVAQHREQVFGSLHPFLADVLEARSRYYLVMNNHALARSDAARAFAIRRNHYEQGFAVMAEHEALAVLQSLRESAGNYFSCLLENIPNDTETLHQAFDILLSVKGRVSDGMIQRQSRLKDNISTHQVLFDEYMAMKGRLSNLYSQGPNPADAAGYRTALDSLTKLVRDLESDLVLQSRDFRVVKSESNVTTADILGSLPNGAILIEYFRYSKFYPKNRASIVHYLVAVLNANGTIALIDLGSSESIDQLIADYRKHFLQVSTKRRLHSSDEESHALIARGLFQKIWAPVQNHIPTGTTGVFIAPDAGLNLIAFGGLMNREKGYLIEEYPIHYLTSSREIVRLRQEEISATGLLLMGNPDYNASATKRASAEEPLASAENRDTHSYLTRNVRTDCSLLHEITVSPLSATEAEVRAIEHHWNATASDRHSEMYVREAASEETFKKRATGKQVIHLATHGYFLSGECAASGSTTSNRENPLLLSGLLLAGANLHGKDADSAGAEDGILTALEVSAMDLRGTDLVVLSACETGLGKVEQGEGVYGLRRAFQMAGAKTVVSSLWKVPDAETMKFMKTLYSTKAKTYPELMQHVALQRIRELRLRGRSTHPFTWGAFVATGDWRIH